MEPEEQKKAEKIKMCYTFALKKTCYIHDTKVCEIHWMSHTIHMVVLQRANSISEETLTHNHRLRWRGHVIRMVNDIIPKEKMYRE